MILLLILPNDNTTDTFRDGQIRWDRIYYKFNGLIKTFIIIKIYSVVFL